jgi:hypothetical protein
MHGCARLSIGWKSNHLFNGSKLPGSNTGSDLGYGSVFDSPRFSGSVGRHERRIRGFPVVEGINVNWARFPQPSFVSSEVGPRVRGRLPRRRSMPSALQFTCRRMEESDGMPCSCIFSTACGPGADLGSGSIIGRGS